MEKLQEKLNDYIFFNFKENSDNSELIKNVFKAGFNSCLEIVEQIIDKKNMLNLSNYLSNNTKVKSATSRKKQLLPDLSFKTSDDGNVIITLSPEFMIKADIQENRLMMMYDPGDNLVLLISHNDEKLFSDFLVGKKKKVKILDEQRNEVLDENGNPKFEEKIGLKNNSFIDKKNSRDETLNGLLVTAGIGNLESYTLNPMVVSDLFADSSQFNIHSVWSVVVNNNTVETSVVEVIKEDNSSINQSEVLMNNSAFELNNY